MGSGIVWQMLTSRICSTMTATGPEAGTTARIPILERYCGDADAGEKAPTVP
jgi:hypothetical protein